jgi:hypothetical protein
MEQNHVMGNKSGGTNEGNVGFCIGNSPTSEAHQILDQFISPNSLKHYTRTLNEPDKSENGQPREPKT